MSELEDVMVYLTSGPDYENGEFVLRSAVPDYAFRAAFDIDGTKFTDREPRMYDVYAIEE
jgi:hypothetical protein